MNPTLPKENLVSIIQERLKSPETPLEKLAYLLSKEDFELKFARNVWFLISLRYDRKYFGNDLSSTIEECWSSYQEYIS
jgi:hypothetical protein